MTKSSKTTKNKQQKLHSQTRSQPQQSQQSQQLQQLQQQMQQKGMEIPFAIQNPQNLTETAQNVHASPEQVMDICQEVADRFSSQELNDIKTALRRRAEARKQGKTSW